MPQTIHTVDAFTDKPFSGNPAAVCILDNPADATWMQNVAMQMDLSETAFLDPASDGHNLRWFTPTVEVDLCGHATLASAHILWETEALKPDQEARFHTKSGLLTAKKHGEWIYLNFPATPPEVVTPPTGLLEALGAKPLWVGKSKFDYLIEVDSEATLRNVSPDFGVLKKVDSRGSIVTARASALGYDFVSRFFAPASGINEDPVTGSAHCALTPYWSPKLNKSRMTASQASRRGGVIRVEQQGERVIIGGQAVTVMRGEMG